ncbi:MAG: hypothetical protein ACLT98_18195 [Eggerthellaceae bacterium]
MFGAFKPLTMDDARNLRIRLQRSALPCTEDAEARSTPMRSSWTMNWVFSYTEDTEE